MDQPGVDIFGQVYNQWKNKECVCPNCSRSIAASRFAPHLEKCLGMGRNSSRIANRRYYDWTFPEEKFYIDVTWTRGKHSWRVGACLNVWNPFFDNASHVTAILEHVMVMRVYINVYLELWAATTRTNQRAIKRTMMMSMTMTGLMVQKRKVSLLYITFLCNILDLITKPLKPFHCITIYECMRVVVLF